MLTNSMAMLAMPTRVAGKAMDAAFEVGISVTLEVLDALRYGGGVDGSSGNGAGGGGADKTSGTVSFTSTAYTYSKILIRLIASSGLRP